MKHEISFEMLCDYIDNKCSEEVKRHVESHTVSCKSCRDKLIIMKRSGIAMAHLKGAELPASFDQGFNRKLNERLEDIEKRRPSYILRSIVEKVVSLALPPAPVLVRIAASLFFIVSAYGILAYSIVQSPVIVLAEGKVNIYSQRKAMWVEKVENYRLAKNDIISVGKGSILDMRQAGKFTIRVKQNSEITVARLLPKYVNGTTIYRVSKGKVLVSISDEFKGSKFVVETPEATATALGTDFLVDVSIGPDSMTRLGVLEGAVKVASAFEPKKDPDLRQVIVGGGEATEVYKGSIPSDPRRLFDEEWAEMVELYQIGDRGQVALLISNGRYRTRELLRPCPIYISDKEPGPLSESLGEIVNMVDKAVKENNMAGHMEAIRRLEVIVELNPDKKYVPQLLLFIGSYYNYLNMLDKAVNTFQLVADEYQDTTFASMALYAIGIIYDEKKYDQDMGNQYYKRILIHYPNSPEAQALRDSKKKP